MGSGQGRVMALVAGRARRRLRRGLTSPGRTCGGRPPCGDDLWARVRPSPGMTHARAYEDTSFHDPT